MGNWAWGIGHGELGMGRIGKTEGERRKAVGHPRIFSFIAEVVARYAVAPTVLNYTYLRNAICTEAT